MAQHGSTALIAAATFVAGGLLSEVVQGAVAIVGGTTALGAGCGRYVAVLRRQSKAAIERATGTGFLIGFSLGLLIAIADVVFGA